MNCDLRLAIYELRITIYDLRSTQELLTTEIVNRKSQIKKEGIMGLNAGLCRRVKQFIDEHFAIIQSVAEVAEKFQVSPAWLTKAFRCHFDLGPKEYLDAVRIRQAMKLLEKRRIHCYEIAQAVGLKDEDALGKLFKRQGIPSPTVLRKRARAFYANESTQKRATKTHDKKKRAEFDC